MRTRTLTLATLCLVVLAALPGATLAAGVEALFDLSSPATGPFPSDRFTERDPTHLTRLRVDLPKPDCVVRPSDCADLDEVNTLDGFNLQPRLSVPFSGAIDPASVTSSNLFLVSLGDTTRPFHGFGRVVGVNQVVWDPATNTLHAESDEFLEEHTRYALIATNDIRDAAGDRVETGHFAPFRHFLGHPFSGDPRLRAYKAELGLALLAARVPAHRVVAVSVFTTQSASAVLDKIRRQIKHAVPDPVDFLLGAGGERTAFSLGSVSSILFTRQIGTLPSFAVSVVPTAALGVIPGAVGTIAFGRYASPDYETAEKFIPAVGTRTGVPAVQATSQVYFNLFLPAGPKPAAGYPVAVFGHGFGDSKQGGPWFVAASLAAQGVATIAINVVGHGGGPLGTLTVNPTSPGAVTLPAGGRGIDQNGNGTIDSTEGSSAAPPRGIIGSRDGLRQTAVDIMQLVRVIETGGMDVGGDGFTDLDPARIYYFGQSFGGIYGTIVLGVEPSLRAGVPNVAGGPIIDVARLGGFRPLVAAGLAARVPSLLNAPPAPPLLGFNENLPLRNQPPLTNVVAGAMAIQEVIENTEWVSQSGNPVAYAPLIRKDPLHGRRPKPVIFQAAKGDQTVPNPTFTNIIRAGDLADRVTYFRNDLAFADNSATPKNPHTFLTNIFNLAVGAFSLAAQAQIATFFATDGDLTIDPDGAGAIFETPIVPPLPEELNFIP